MPFCVIIGKAPSSCKESALRIMGAQSVQQLYLSITEGPFEVASFEHFGLERHFNMAAMIVFSPKCPSEGDISCLERTVSFNFQCILFHHIWPVYINLRTFYLTVYRKRHFKENEELRHISRICLGYEDISLLETFKWQSIIVAIINIYFSMATKECRDCGSHSASLKLAVFLYLCKQMACKSNP